MSYNNGPKIVTNGLVLYLDAANSRSYPGSGTVWTDLSNRITGSLVNGPTFNSSNGGSIVFDGNNRHALISSNTILDLNNRFSFCLFIKRNGNATQIEEQFLEREHGATPNAGGYSCWIDRTTLLPVIRIRNSSNSSDMLTASTAITSSWVFLTFLYDTPTLQIYVNGSIAGSKSSTVTTIGSTIKNLGIGSQPNAPGYAWNGNIAQTLMYNRALSAAEIRQNYHASKGRFGL